MHRSSVSFINRLLVSGLVWLVVMMFIFYGSEAIYTVRLPDKPAYDIAPGNEATQAQTSAGITPASPDSILAGRLQKADVKRGAAIFRRHCILCHAASGKGADRRPGPDLWHIVGRAPAAQGRFSYSRAMRNFAEKGYLWDFATLDAYLAAPALAVPGTIMSFAGLRDEQERADVLLYLNSLPDEPAALPPVDTGKNDGRPE